MLQLQFYALALLTDAGQGKCYSLALCYVPPLSSIIFQSKRIIFPSSSTNETISLILLEEELHHY